MKRVLEKNIKKNNDSSIIILNFEKKIIVQVYIIIKRYMMFLCSVLEKNDQIIINAVDHRLNL